MLEHEILIGDCLDRLKDIPDGSVDSVVTDPPYELGFMGKSWDATGIAYNVDMWREVLRVMKPGAHLLAFGGTRTYHRMTCAIEDAGFQIRDCLQWLYGTGFPKSLDVSKAIDAAAGATRRVVGVNANHRPVSGVAYEGVYAGGNTGAATLTAPATDAARQWSGWGTALKPANEPIVLARKPLIDTVVANVLAHGTGGINVDGCRIGYASATDMDKARVPQPMLGVSADGVFNFKTGVGRNGDAFDPSKGRWPANVLLDEEAAAVLDAATGVMKSGVAVQRNGGGQKIGGLVAYQGSNGLTRPDVGYGDCGGASRFFYTAKASRTEREAGLSHLPVKTGGELTDRVEGSAGLNSARAGAVHGAGRHNTHPTVKPIALMRYLCRLITPSGGVVLDPFTGSGTTGVAALMEGFEFLGIEREAEYVTIAEARLSHAVKEAA